MLREPGRRGTGIVYEDVLLGRIVAIKRLSPDMARAVGVVARLERARTDPDFRNRLRADPADVLREAGVEMPQGARCEVVDVSIGDIFLPLGARTGNSDLDRILDCADCT